MGTSRLEWLIERSGQPRSQRRDRALLVSCGLDRDDDVSLAYALSVLSDEERDRVGRFRSRLQGARHARARAFLRRELGIWTAVAPAALELRQEANGKPVVAGGPHFNLAHSEGLAVLAISPNAPVGVDLEMARRDIDVDALAAECLEPGEMRILDALSGEERVRRFLAFWTAKEARMKLTGEGLSLAPSKIRLDLRNGWPVGVAAPASPPTLIETPDLGIPDAICAVAEIAPGQAAGLAEARLPPG